MAQIDGKFLVDGYEAATRVVDFLSKTNRIFGCVHFFDVPSAPTGAAHKFAKITSATIRQLFPRFEFSFVLGARSQSQVRLPHDLRLTQPPLQRRGVESLNR